MKFKPGDVVYYDKDVCLCGEFVDKWGRGPFIVREAGDTLTLTTMDGDPVRREYKTPWNHTAKLMSKNTFMTAVNQAIKKETHAQGNTRTKAKQKTRTKSAARRGRAA